MLETGRLNKRIELQHYVETRDAVGWVTKTWSTYATVWAALRTLSGRERDVASQERATLSHEITIRYRSGVHADHRIVRGGRTFDIKDARNVDEGNVEIRMRCIEVTAAGPSASPSPSSSASSSPSSSVSSSPS